MSQAALNIEIVKYSYGNNYTSIVQASDMQVIADKLNYYKKKMLEDYDSWKYCSSSDKIRENLIPFYTFEAGQKTETGSIYTIVDDFISRVNFK